MLCAEGHTIYMGKDKFENEDLIRYGFLEDIWCVLNGIALRNCMYERLL